MSDCSSLNNTSELTDSSPSSTRVSVTSNLSPQHGPRTRLLSEDCSSAELYAKLRILRQAYKELQKSILLEKKQHANDLSSLQTQYDELDRQLHTESNHRAVLQDRYMRFLKENDHLKAKVDSLTAACNKLSSEKDSLQKDYTCLTKEHDSLAGTITQLNDKLILLVRDRRAIRTACDVLTAQNKRLQQKLHHHKRAPEKENTDSKENKSKHLHVRSTKSYSEETQTKDRYFARTDGSVSPRAEAFSQTTCHAFISVGEQTEDYISSPVSNDIPDNCLLPSPSAAETQTQDEYVDIVTHNTLLAELDHFSHLLDLKTTAWNQMQESMNDFHYLQTLLEDKQKERVIQLPPFIYLLCHNQKYMSHAYSYLFGDSLIASGASCERTERFKCELRTPSDSIQQDTTKQRHHIYALLSVSCNKYVTANLDGSVKLGRNASDEITDLKEDENKIREQRKQEEWTVKCAPYVEGNKILFVSCYGSYLSVDDTDAITCDAEITPLPTQQFYVKDGNIQETASFSI